MTEPTNPFPDMQQLSLDEVKYAPLLRWRYSHLYLSIDSPPSSTALMCFQDNFLILKKLYASLCWFNHNLTFDCIVSFVGDVHDPKEIIIQTRDFRKTNIAWKTFDKPMFEQKFAAAKESKVEQIQRQTVFVERGVQSLLHLEHAAHCLLDYIGTLSRRWIVFDMTKHKGRNIKFVFPRIIYDRKIQDAVTYDIHLKPVPVWIIKLKSGPEHVIDIARTMIGLNARETSLADFEAEMQKEDCVYRWAKLDAYEHREVRNFNNRYATFGTGDLLHTAYQLDANEKARIRYVRTKDPLFRMAADWTFDIRPRQYLRDFEKADFLWAANYRTWIAGEMVFRLIQYTVGPHAYYFEPEDHKECQCLKEPIPKADSERPRTNFDYYLTVSARAKAHVDEAIDRAFFARCIIQEQGINVRPFETLLEQREWREVGDVLQSRDFWAQGKHANAARGGHFLGLRDPFTINLTHCAFLLLLTKAVAPMGAGNPPAEWPSAIPQLYAGHVTQGGAASIRNQVTMLDRLLAAFADLAHPTVQRALGELLDPVALSERGACPRELLAVGRPRTGGEMRAEHAALLSQHLAEEQRWKGVEAAAGKREERRAARRAARVELEKRVREDLLQAAPALLARDIFSEEQEKPLEQALAEGRFWVVGPLVVRVREETAGRVAALMEKIEGEAKKRRQLS